MTEEPAQSPLAPAETFEWRVNPEWKFWGILLTLLFQYWVWAPVLAGQSHPPLLLVVLTFTLAPLLARRRVTVDAAGLRVTGLWGRHVPWDSVRKLHISGPFGTWLPMLQLDYGPEVTRKWWSGRGRGRVGLYVPAIATRDLVEILRRHLRDDQICPRLLTFATGPVRRGWILALLAVQIGIASIWTTILLNRALCRGGSLEVRPAAFLLFALVGMSAFARPFLEFSRRWYEKERGLREFADGLTCASPHLLFLVVIPVHSGICFAGGLYGIFWLVLAFECAAVLQLLRYFVRTPSSRWCLVISLGWLLWPGRELLWEWQHTRIVVLATREHHIGALGEGKAAMMTGDPAFLPDGRIAVLLHDAKGKRGQLAFLTADLAEQSRIEVPSGYLLTVHGSWVWWYVGDGMHCVDTTAPDAQQTFPDLRFARCGYGVTPGPTAFGYRRDSDAAKVFRVDLETGRMSALFECERVSSAVQTSADSFLWCAAQEDTVEVWRWNDATGNELVFSRATAESEETRLSIDLQALLVGDRRTQQMKVLSVDGTTEWKIPVGVPSEKPASFRLPHLLCYDRGAKRNRLFRFDPGGNVQELPIPDISFPGRATVSPDLSAIATVPDIPLFSSPVLVDVRAGTARRLLSFAWTSANPWGTDGWSNRQFLCIDLPGFGRQTVLVKIDFDARR